MKDGYVNPGQEPFILPEDLVNTAPNPKELRKCARMQNRKYYKLTTLKSKLSPLCRTCGRRICLDHDACKAKERARQEAKSNTDWYFRSE